MFTADCHHYPVQLHTDADYKENPTNCTLAIKHVKFNSLNLSKNTICMLYHYHAHLIWAVRDMSIELFFSVGYFMKGNQLLANKYKKLNL